MLMSGCGTTDIVNIPAAITDLTITDAQSGGDLLFTFTYIDNPDVTGTFIIDYARVSEPANWSVAPVVDSLGAIVDLTDKAPGEYTFYWDTDIQPGTLIGDYFFRVRVDLSDAIADIPDVNVVERNVQNTL